MLQLLLIKLLGEPPMTHNGVFSLPIKLDQVCLSVGGVWESTPEMTH